MKRPRLQHISIPVPAGSQDQVRAFYEGVLGLEEKPAPPSLAQRGIIWLSVGDGEMEIHCVPDTYLPNPKEARHFCLEVDNLDSYRQKVIEAGCEIIEAEPIPNRPRFFFHDPFRNRVELTTILGDYREAQ